MNFFQRFLSFSILILIAIEPIGAIGFPLHPSWHIQFQGIQQFPHRDIFDVDLFDTSKSTIKKIHTQGALVICYMSAGTSEDWRPDVLLFPASALGNPVSGWKGEDWLDIRNPDILLLMQKRMDLARSKGCDGIDPDNVNGYENETGFDLSLSDAIAYNTFLIEYAHKKNLLIGLKNSQSLISNLGKMYDFFINESCYSYNECIAYNKMVMLGKPVIIMEYTTLRRDWCRKAKKNGFVLQYFDINLGKISQECSR